MAIRCWAKYFASVDRSLPTVSVPIEWVDFFTLLMLKQGSYDWAKDFLNSSAWTFPFTLPSTKPSVVITELAYAYLCWLYQLISVGSTDAFSDKDSAGLQATQQVVILEDVPSDLIGSQASVGEQSTPPQPPPPPALCKPMPRAKRGKAAPISDSHLQRSDRLHKLNKGFKSSVCKDSNCLGCSTDPPVLSPSIVRDLGATFCNIDPSKLTDDSLHAKPQKSGAVGQLKSKKSKRAKDPVVGCSKSPKNSSSGVSPSKSAKDPSQGADSSKSAKN